MLIVLIRALILYVAVVVVMRLMGKQEIAKLQPFELVIALIIADLAAIPMTDTGVPLISGLIPLIAILFAQVVLSYASLKSVKFRSFLNGTPSVLVENGKIVENELKRLRYNINDLLEQLRIKNVPNITDVEFAILETDGQLSIIPKSQKRPLTPEDIQVPTKYEGIPITLIIDGQVLTQNLEKANLDLNWLNEELAKSGIDTPKKILFANLNTGGELYFQLKNNH
ncbi:YetF domain-containing protein [Desulfolucanica intricata]|uniref:YetF domain-containing protein n=1 Tax=Desulfolucanica intricata TaxID=1285191 RepID=UPI0008376798|nr:DUF421 domain-containing protein [Desulfolucanica intricata]